jgi:type IV pilus assembly protein PilM
VAVLNIGASISNLNLLDNCLPCLSRDIKTAGNNFTKKIIDTLGVDLPTAEDLKINPEKDKSNKLSGVIEQVITNLATEIRTSFDYYESQCPATVSKIYISGGGSLLKGLKEILNGMLDIEVAYWDPFSNIEIANAANSDKLNSIKNNAQPLSSALSVAVGLALRQ